MYIFILPIQFSRENFHEFILLKQVTLQKKIKKAEPLGRQTGLIFLLTEGGRKLTNGVTLPSFFNTRQSVKR